MYSDCPFCYELKEAHDKNNKKFDDMVNNFLRFAMDNFETELVVMGIQTCTYAVCSSLIPMRLRVLMNSMSVLASILLFHRAHKPKELDDL